MIILTIREDKLLFTKANYFYDRRRPALIEMSDIEFDYKSLLSNLDYYKFLRAAISAMHIQTSRTKKFSLSAWIYFHNRAGSPIIRMDRNGYNGPSEFLEKIDIPSPDYDTLVEDDKFMARVGQITLKHLFDTPMIFEK